MITASTEIIEEKNYYPFGLQHKGYNDVVNSLGNSKAQKFSYNNQELEETLSLNLIEMDWRGYAPAYSRFIQIDPLADIFSQMDKTTYNFSWNNPIYYNDPSGLCPECPSEAKEGQLYNSTGGETYKYENGQWVRQEGKLEEVIVDANPKKEENSTEDSTSNSSGNGDSSPAIFYSSSKYDYGVEHDILTSQKAKDDFYFIFNGIGGTLEQRWAMILVRDWNADPEAAEDVKTAASAIIPIRFARGKRNISLPSYKKVSVDMKHILSGHTRGGSRVSSIKDLFADHLSPNQMEKMVRQAFRNFKKIKYQGDRFELRGASDNGTMIEMWYNKVTKMIETAYPYSR